MLLINYDFYDIYAVLCNLRFYTDEPCKTQIIDKIKALIDAPQKDNIVRFNLVRRALSEIPSLDREKWTWVFTNNAYTYGIATMEDALCYEILSSGFAELSLCVQKPNHQEQLFDLTDALHNVPTLLADGCKNIKRQFALKFLLIAKSGIGIFYGKNWESK